MPTISPAALFGACAGGIVKMFNMVERSEAKVEWSSVASSSGSSRRRHAHEFGRSARHARGAQAILPVREHPWRAPHPRNIVGYLSADTAATQASCRGPHDYDRRSSQGLKRRSQAGGASVEASEKMAGVMDDFVNSSRGAGAAKTKDVDETGRPVFINACTLECSNRAYPLQITPCSIPDICMYSGWGRHTSA